MKEITNHEGIISRIKTSEYSAAVFSHVIAAALGFISSRAVMPGKLVPFGISFAAAVPYEYLPSAAIGSFAGYFIPAIGSGGFRYIAAVLSVLAIRILLSSYKPVTTSQLFICLLPALSLGVTAPVLSNSKSAPALVAEVLLSALAAGTMNITFRAMTHRKAGFSAEELAAFVVCLAVWLTGIGDIRVGGIYFYRCFCVLLILLAARYGGPAVSITMGTAAAFCVVLASNNPSMAIVFVIIGLCEGVFRSYGKWVMSFVCIAACLMGMVFTDNLLIPALLVETAIGCTVFMSMPKHAGAEVGKLLSVYPKVSMQSDLKKMVKVKLLDAADALLDVKNTVNEVSDRLSIINAPDFSKMIREIENTACAGCKLRIHCWETRRDATNDALSAIITAKKEGSEDPCKSLPEEFRIRCLKSESFCSTALNVYEKYAAVISAQNRTKEVRQVVSEQFEGISVMLKETANEISLAQRFDKTAALCAAAALKNIDIFANEAACKIDKYGRMTIKIKATKQDDTVINKMKIMRLISTGLDRDFGVPTVSEKNNDVFITLTEAPAFKVSTGVCQITAAGNSMCGDSYRFLTDGQGRFFSVLSDGMGTGGAAAVDSALSAALLTRLIKSGIGLESALKIINSSMLFKSTNESTATVDVACVDLFTGLTEFYKAGAAPSLIKHGSRVGSAVGKTLPIGILSDVCFDKSSIKLKGKDVVLMMSDGACGEGLEWIKRELENSGEATAQSIADNIAAAARRHRTLSRDDDITVIAVVIEKAA